MNTETSACGFLQELPQLQSCRENLPATCTSRVANSRSTLLTHGRAHSPKAPQSPAPWFYLENLLASTDFFPPSDVKSLTLSTFPTPMCPYPGTFSPYPSIPFSAPALFIRFTTRSQTSFLSSSYLICISMSYTSNHNNSLFPYAVLFPELMCLCSSRPQAQPSPHMLPGCLSQAVCSVSLLSLLVSISLSFYLTPNFWPFKPLSFT